MWMPPGRTGLVTGCCCRAGYNLKQLTVNPKLLVAELDMTPRKMPITYVAAIGVRGFFLSGRDLHTARDLRNAPPDYIRHAGFHIRAERTLAPVRQFFGGVR
jgi:hypothetical protein